MHKFTDASGTDWNVTLNLTNAKSLRDNGCDILDGNRFQEMTADLISMGDLIYRICESQCKSRDVDDSQFGELLTECFEAAVTATREELRDFFRKLGMEAQANIAEKLSRATGKLQTVAVSKVKSEKMDQAIESQMKMAEQQLDEAIESLICGETSIESPAPSA